MEEPAPTSTLRTVAQLAHATGVTVRTLHHYDAIGLLVPSARSDAEYRLYSDADLTRLREILTWRRVGMPLARIAALLDDPDVDRRAALEQQRSLVAVRIEELAALAAALDRALGQHEEEPSMATDRAIIEALDGFDPADHEDEARARWGDTEAHRESARRTKDYTADVWRTIKGEADAITDRLAALFADGADPAGDEAQQQAEAWRAHVSRWFHECPPELLRGLGEMYVADPRFTRHYDGDDGARAGFAAWVRDAWVARAERG